MTDHTYAGHTLAEIKTAAERAEPLAYMTYKGQLFHAADPKVQDHSNPKPMYDDFDPATVLAMAARIKGLELVAERNELLWVGWKGKAKGLERERDAAQNFANCAKLELERVQAERDAAVESRRNAQQELATLREERNRLGVLAEARAHGAADQHRLEGWQAAREQAAKVCDDRAIRNEQAAQDGIANGEQEEVSSLRSAAWQMSLCAANIRAMQPPAEWQCAEVPPVCGAAPNAEIGTLTNEGTKWPHDDGFGGGLTERKCDE